MIKRMPYGEEFLDWYYNKGGMQAILFGTDSVSGVPPAGELIKKVVGPWDAPVSPYTTYFEPVYSAAVHMWVARQSEVYSLLPKTTYISEGDSIKYVETDLATLTGLTHASAPYTLVTAESGPTIGELDNCRPAHVIDPWELSLLSMTYSSWQNQPKNDPAFIRNYHAELLPSQIDAMLTQTVDTASNDATHYNIESIDRMCSNAAEATTTYCSSEADPDLWYSNGSGSVLVDRSADTDNTFGGGAGTGLGISLPATAAARILSLDLIDDVVAEIAPYSKRKRFIGITGHKTMNEMQKLIDPKQRYLDNPMDYQLTLSGVSTRKGVEAGFTVGAYVSNGISIPFFPTRSAANELSTNRSATVTDANIGNIYILDLDGVEIREAFPITYLETPPEAMLTANLVTRRAAFLYSAQLLSTNFRAQGAIKYLKAT